MWVCIVKNRKFTILILEVFMIEENQPSEEQFTGIANFQPKAPKFKPELGYGGQLAVLIGLIGAGIILGSFASIPIWLGMTHTSIFDMQKNMFNPAYANAMKMVQLVSTLFAFFLPAFVYARVVNKKPLKHLGFITTISSRQVFLVVLIATAGLFLSGALAELNQIIPIPKNWSAYFHKLEDDYSDQVLIMAKMKSFGDFLFTLIVIALVPAIVEESLFRGALQQILVKWFRNAWMGILVTSIIFSAIHMSYYGFLPRAALGLILGFLYYYSKNIWLNILAHFLNNGIAVTSLYWDNIKGKFSKESMDDTTFPWYLGVLALVFIIGLMIEYRKECIKLGCENIDNTISPSDNPFE